MDVREALGVVPFREDTVPARPASAGAALATLASLVACGRNVSVESVRVDTLAGGRIVVTNPDVPSLKNGELPLLVEGTAHRVHERECDGFGQAFSVAVDHAGRIYVADRQANEIRVFDALWVVKLGLSPALAGSGFLLNWTGFADLPRGRHLDRVQLPLHLLVPVIRPVDSTLRPHPRGGHKHDRGGSRFLKDNRRLVLKVGR